MVEISERVRKAAGLGGDDEQPVAGDQYDRDEEPIELD